MSLWVRKKGESVVMCRELDGESLAVGLALLKCQHLYDRYLLALNCHCLSHARNSAHRPLRRRHQAFEYSSGDAQTRVHFPSLSTRHKLS